MPNNNNLTSIFFADDSTLLCTSLQAGVDQMASVEDFCSVPGPRLITAKCKTLALKSNLVTEEINADGLLKALQTLVKFLGILFGRFNSTSPNDNKFRARAALNTIASSSHPFIALNNGQALPFELRPRPRVMRTAYHAPLEDNSQPMTTSTRLEPCSIVKYMCLARTTISVDVWLCLQLRMLPISSSQFNLQPQQPRIPTPRLSNQPPCSSTLEHPCSRVDLLVSSSSGQPILTFPKRREVLKDIASPVHIPATCCQTSLIACPGTI